MTKQKKATQELPTVNELSIEEIKSYKGLENLTEVEAEQVASALQVFSLITYQLFETEIKLCNEQS